MRNVAVVSARRTVIGRYLGSLKKKTAPELGSLAAMAALEDAGNPDIDEVIFGHGRQAGNGPNPARQVLRKAGLPDTVPAMTINKACASSLRAITIGSQSIACGEADTILVGGMEAMSRTPYYLDGARSGYRLGHGELVDGMYRDGFLCPLCGDLMGETAETLADDYKISREEQDRYALESQTRCEAARKGGRFDSEIVSVPLKGDKVLEIDEHARDGVTMESLAKLPTVFRKNGTVHAGNSSGITDGGSALVLMAEDKLEGRTPLARIAGSAVAGLDPSRMGLGPVPAFHKLQERTGWEMKDYDLMEVNEAFAAQVIACDRELKYDWSRTNVNGGAIALGHPIGATGARIVVTLLHEMQRRDSHRGLATLCVSGGLGMAIAFER
ncbi:MAG: acetyl-CoA C-acetyltransferase [Planctomycetota bacterium]|nr:acetyl-CoA C-acetyltransferase [Planctomycetota bacterium]